MQFITELPILSILIWLPIFSGFLIAFLGNNRPLFAKQTALLVAILSFALSLGLWSAFDSSVAGFQFIESKAWLPNFDIGYYLGVDGFAVPLIVLTCFFSPIIVIAAWKVIQQRVATYMAAFLIMQGILCGVFMALDAILFYLFWEAMLIPMFLIIGIWGGTERVYAAVKFFLYTFVGSIFLLIALLYLHMAAVKQGIPHSFSILSFYQVSLSATEQAWIFFAMLIAFAVKIPMWPVHTWLPDAHVQAPTGGSVILAAIMLKLGGYGFLRFILPIAPEASIQYAWVVIGASLIAVVYIGLVALVQQDMKKLIAYSSIAHMGFVTLGFITAGVLAANQKMDAAAMGIDGAYMQMISHGFISGALFLCVGVLYDRMHSRQIKDYGGVVNTMPVFAAFAVFFSMANVGLPGTSGFVGEFLVILSVFQANVWFAILAAMTLILGAAYSLWMVKRVIYGAVSNPGVAKLTDIDCREFIFLSVLAAMVLLFGIWPKPVLDTTVLATQTLLEFMSNP
jgi:NADH-quinone oxidoreductase subunit M